MLTVSANSTNRAYGVTNPVFTVTYYGFVNGDTPSVLSGVPSLTTSAKTNSPIGNYVITNGLGTLSASNYTFNPVNFTNAVLTVSNTPLVVAASSIARVYGVTNPPLTLTYIGFVNGEGTNVLSGSLPTLNASSATLSKTCYSGTYVITNIPGTLSDSNYSISYSNGILNVTQAVVTVTADNASRNYGAPNPSFSVTYSGFVLLDSSNVLSGLPSVTTPATTNSLGGTYPIIVTNGTLFATNYSFNFVNGTLTVVQIQGVLTVTANSVSRGYGATNPVLTVSYSGFFNGDTTNVLSGAPVLATSAATNSSVGNYVITNSIGTLSASHYTFIMSNGTLSVTQAVLTVTANNTNRNFGATNPVFTVGYSGFVLGQTTSVLSGAPSVTTSATTNSAAGSYPIVVTNGTLSAANYSFSFVNGTLTVVGGGGLPQLGSVNVVGGQLVFGWQSTLGKSYQVQYNDDLTTTNWNSLGNPISGTGGYLTTTNSVGLSLHRFFRLQSN